MEKKFGFQRCLLLPEFPVLSAFLLPRGRLQSSTSGSGRGATAETELTLTCPLVSFDLLDNRFRDCALGNSSFHAKAGNEIKAAISWVRGAVVVARAQSHDQPSWQTGCQRQTGVLQHQWKPVLKRRVFLMLIRSTAAGPTGETRLRGSSFSRWGLLPREPASQSHLHYTVTAWTHQSNSFPRLPMLTLSCCLHRQSQHIRNIAEELDPTFQARRLSTERDRDRQTGTVNRKWSSESSLLNNGSFTSSLPLMQGWTVRRFPCSNTTS